MPAKTINLLTQKEFDKSPLGRLLRWSLSYGRYIIVSTEIIVLLAFIYRFSLDRKITDLNDEIEQKSAIVEANLGFENRFRNLQKRVDQIAILFTNQDLVIQVLKHLEQITPTGIRYASFSFSDNLISINGTANTNTSLSFFITNLKSSPLLTNIDITSLSKKSSTEITFMVDAQIKNR